MATVTIHPQLQEMLADPARRDEGFRQLMKHFGERLYWHIRRLVVGRDDAEDVLQETFVRVFEHVDSYRGEGSLEAWLYRIATNESLRHLRRQTRLFQPIDALGELLTEKLVAEVPLDADEAEVLLQKALLTLPTQQRIVFNLRYFDSLPYEEMSAITGKSIGTLKTSYHYAAEKIRNYIKQYGQ